jgi:hypothetical protein
LLSKNTPWTDSGYYLKTNNLDVNDWFNSLKSTFEIIKSKNYKKEYISCINFAENFSNNQHKSILHEKYLIY